MICNLGDPMSLRHPVRRATLRMPYLRMYIYIKRHLSRITKETSLCVYIYKSLLTCIYALKGSIFKVNVYIPEKSPGFRVAMIHPLRRATLKMPYFTLHIHLKKTLTFQKRPFYISPKGTSEVCIYIPKKSPGFRVAMVHPLRRATLMMPYLTMYNVVPSVLLFAIGNPAWRIRDTTRL